MNKERRKKKKKTPQTQRRLEITPTATERSAQLTVLMRQVENRLRQVSRLHDTAYFDGAFVFDEFAD